MAITLVSTVLTRYKADTSQQKKAIKGLKGEELKRHKALLKQTEQQNDKLDGQIAMWAKVGVAIGGVTVAAKVLSSGLDTLQKNSALNAATVGVNLDKLRKSTAGLVDDTRLLEFASKAMNGTFKLSQQEMDQALQGALALRKTLGVDLTKALEVTQKAITEGTTEPLKELGLVIKGPENDTEEGLQAVLVALNEQAAELGGNFGLAGDGIKAAGISMDNTADSISEDLGKIAVALEPVIAGFAALVGLIARAGEASDFLAGVETRTAIKQAEDALQAAKRDQALFAAGRGPEGGLRTFRFGAGSQAEQLAGRVAASQAQLDQLERDADDRRFRAQNRADQERFAKRQAAAALARGGAGRGGGGFEAVSADPSQRGNIIQGSAVEQLFGFDRADQAARQAEDRRSGLAALDEIREFSTDITSSLDILEENLKKFAELDAATGQSNLLASVFGTPTEIDATAEALSALSQGFDGLANAFGAGVDALITGSDSFAEAFKSAIGESLRSMAVEMSIRAIREAAFGVGELALGNIPAAAIHGKAAAMFGIGAVAAGVAARGLGAGSSGGARPSAAVGAGAGSAGVAPARAGEGTGGAANGNTGRTQIFIVGDDFGSLSSRQREARFRQIARGSGFNVPNDVIRNG